MAIRTSTAGRPGIFAQIYNIYNAFFGPQPSGPLISQCVYRTYESIYRNLALIPSHHPPHQTLPLDSSIARLPYRVAYHVWKPQPNFKKSDPPQPDFRVVVVSARDMGVPTLAQLSALFDSVPVDSKAAGKSMFQKLKDGHRNVILAVVDAGVTSFLKFGDVGFADEPLYMRKPAGRGGKGGRGVRGGGRGGRGGGRGGQGGRGRGGQGGRGRGKG